MTWLRGLGIALAAAFLVGTAFAAPANPPDVTIFGDIDHGDNQSYIEVPFDVPRGVTRITVRFEYDRANSTVIDLGLMDQSGFRGWSGGNKSTFSVGVTEATPSYLPGPIRPGRWRLLLGVPNIREGVTSRFKAVISFETGRAARPARPAPYPQPVLNPQAGWYRGDLHTHTANSDGVCASADGAVGPCPLVRTLSAAKAAGLDFIAITDHNTISQFAEMARLQGEWASLLLIPGREITTFRGHANVLFATEPIDFRRSMSEIAADADRLSALLVVNHPGLPSGESCMGCGWTWGPEFAESRGAYTASRNGPLLPGQPGFVEVVNGGAWKGTTLADGPFSGVAWWEVQLNAGRRYIALGGSDNHDARSPLDQPGSVGRPTTVVWASNLSQAGIREGLLSGRVFIDMGADRSHVLDLTAEARGVTYTMGASVYPVTGEVNMKVLVAGIAAGRVRIIMDGRTVRLSDDSISASRKEISFSVPYEGGDHWVRAEVRAPDGALLMLGNPIFLRSSRKAIVELSD